MTQDNENTTRGTPEQAREMWRAQQEQERAQRTETQRIEAQLARGERISEVQGNLHHGGTRTPDNQEHRLASIAVDRNFSVGRRGEDSSVDTAQAESMALAADFMANMGAGETLQYAVQHGMAAFTTTQRNNVRYTAAVEAVGIYLREQYPNMQAQDVDALVQAAVPVARDMVRERQ